MLGIFYDIYSLSNDTGIAMFYGNNMYTISGIIYVYYDIYDRNTEVYMADFQGGVALIRSICDASRIIPPPNSLYFKQMIQISQCDYVAYLRTPAIITRGGTIVLGLFVMVMQKFNQ
jgi:hypothetical protein